MNSSRVEQCVESMCHKGCKALWADIHSLQQGDPLPETQTLSSKEADQVLTELKSIMAVYEGSCTPEEAF